MCFYWVHLWYSKVFQAEHVVFTWEIIKSAFFFYFSRPITGQQLSSQKTLIYHSSLKKIKGISLLQFRNNMGLLACICSAILHKSQHKFLDSCCTHQRITNFDNTFPSFSKRKQNIFNTRSLVYMRNFAKQTAYYKNHTYLLFIHFGSQRIWRNFPIYTSEKTWFTYCLLSTRRWNMLHLQDTELFDNRIKKKVGHPASFQSHK